MDTDANSMEEAMTPGGIAPWAKVIAGFVVLGLLVVLGLVLAREPLIQARAASNVPGQEVETIPATTVAPDRRPSGRYDSDALAFDDGSEPTFVAHLAGLGSERIREIEFFLPAGDGDISFAIRNPEPIRTDGQGIAVRTDDVAQILRSSQRFEMPRPIECIDGQCRLFMWLTMGPQFLGQHPEAELLIWAGEGAAVTIEQMPMSNIRDETYR